MCDSIMINNSIQPLYKLNFSILKFLSYLTPRYQVDFYSQISAASYY